MALIRLHLDRVVIGDLARLLPIWPTNFKTPGGRQFYRRLSMPRNEIPELAQLHAELHGGLMRPLFVVLERAQKKGELAARHRVADVVAAIVGPLFYRRWFSKESIDSHFVKGVVRSIVERTSPK